MLLMKGWVAHKYRPDEKKQNINAEIDVEVNSEELPFFFDQCLHYGMG